RKKGRRQADGPSLGRKRPRRAAENRAETRYRAAPICFRTAQNAGATDLSAAWLFITPRRADLAAWVAFPAAPIGQKPGRYENRLQCKNNTIGLQRISAGLGWKQVDDGPADELDQEPAPHGADVEQRDGAPEQMRRHQRPAVR